MEIATWRDYEGIDADSHWQLKPSVIWTFEPLSTCLQYSAMLGPRDEWTDLQPHSPAMFEASGLRQSQLVPVKAARKEEAGEACQKEDVVAANQMVAAVVDYWTIGGCQ